MRNLLDSEAELRMHEQALRDVQTRVKQKEAIVRVSAVPTDHAY